MDGVARQRRDLGLSTAAAAQPVRSTAHLMDAALHSGNRGLGLFRPPTFLRCAHQVRADRQIDTVSHGGG